jgi:aminoglycoside phosphotransferase (APT) family kinase protein
VSSPAKPDIDPAALALYLAPRIAGFRAPLAVKRFEGGQSNPTYLLTDADGRRYVLRRQPDGELLPSAHAIDREYRVVRALASSAVPVARMIDFCEDRTVAGTAFYVMEFVEGRIFWDPALPELAAGDRARLYDDINRVVAELHRVNPAAGGLGDFGRAGQFFERQIARWSRQYRAAETDRIEAMDRLIAWLPAHIPASDAVALVHGDLRIDNMIIHPTEPRVLALIDWELSTLGHPLADFAYHALPWRLSSTQFRGMAEKVPLPPGVPTEQAYLAQYEERTGTPIDRRAYEFCRVYSLFRLASILQGVFRRGLAGNASSGQAREIGAKARGIAEAAWQQVRTQFPGEC